MEEKRKKVKKIQLNLIPIFDFDSIHEAEFYAQDSFSNKRLAEKRVYRKKEKEIEKAASKSRSGHFTFKIFILARFWFLLFFKRKKIFFESKKNRESEKVSTWRFLQVDYYPISFFIPLFSSSLKMISLLFSLRLDDFVVAVFADDDDHWRKKKEYTGKPLLLQKPFRKEKVSGF